MNKKVTKKHVPDEDIFGHYNRMAKMLGSMFAPFLEVVVHDLRRPKHSIILIENGQITGRKVGDATTDLGLKRIQSDASSSPQVPDQFFNYGNSSPRGHKLKSSSLAIRNGQGKLIGSICLNFSCKEFLDLSRILEQFCRTENSHQEKFELVATAGEISGTIRNYLVEQGLIGKHLTALERSTLVSHLKERGFFRMRGAIGIIAKELGVTRPSIYNDLKV